MMATLLFFVQQTHAQDSTGVVPTRSLRVIAINPRHVRVRDSIWLISGICKPLAWTTLKKQAEQESPASRRQPLLTVHGNLRYEFTYRSLVDTPFAQEDFKQHFLQTNLEMVWKESYPVRISFSTRISNSPYFKDRMDVNLQFSKASFFSIQKRKILDRVTNLAAGQKLRDLEDKYKAQLLQIRKLQEGPLNKDIQDGVEKKEIAAGGRNFNNIRPEDKNLQKQLNDQILRKGSRSDSIDAEVGHITPANSMSSFEQRQQELARLLRQADELLEELKNARKEYRDTVSRLRREVLEARDMSALDQFARLHDLPSLPKAWKVLSSIESLSIGRSWVDYTDLTVRNISLTGVNVEVNPSRFYLAVAAGKINYRFRDFIINNNSASPQSLFLLRTGWGVKDNSNLIFSWYNGKRGLLNDMPGNPVSAPQRVMGVSLAGRIAVRENNFVEAEVGKSTIPLPAGRGELKPGDIINFHDRSNEAYAIRFGSAWPETDTRINGFYRHMGSHFQSFNLQPVNSSQEAYQLKLQQGFWKKQLQVDIGVQKNNFSNPFINPGIASKTVFKSVQAMLRIRKLPFITIGFFPTSQLTVLPNNQVVENQYNTLNGVLGYSYRFGKAAFSTNLVALRFYNQSSDTGFIYYNASSVSVSQSVFLGKVQLQTGWVQTNQERLRIVTLDQSLNIQLAKWLNVRAGVKWSRSSIDKSFWGGNGGIGVTLKGFGIIQGNYERSFLPGTNRNLLPVTIGRIAYYRNF